MSGGFVQLLLITGGGAQQKSTELVVRRKVFIVELEGGQFCVDGFLGASQFPEHVTEVGLVICGGRFEGDCAAEVFVSILIMTAIKEKPRINIELKRENLRRDDRADSNKRRVGARAREASLPNS